MTNLPQTPFAYRLFAQLWAVVEEELRRYGMDIQPNCSGLLQDHIAKAVKELLGNNTNPDNVSPALGKNIGVAELNLRIFILKMIRRARKDNKSKTREDDFKAAEKEEGTIFTGKKYAGR
jgi:hypothetical protein